MSVSVPGAVDRLYTRPTTAQHLQREHIYSYSLVVFSVPDAKLCASLNWQFPWCRGLLCAGCVSSQLDVPGLTY